MAQTSKYDFRILLETVAGSKLSYYSSSFVDTSQELVLSASQVYHRITGSFSSSYVNSKFTSSAETFDVISGSGNTFGENKLLSASLSGSLNTGSIIFTSLDTEYDRLLRYKFIGDKVCSVLGLPSEQWVYVDQVRLAPDDQSNYFEGNIKAHNIFIDNTIQISNTAHVDSNIPILIHTQSAESSDRFLKFVEVDGVPKNSLLFGYNASASRYELSSSADTTFEIVNVDDIRASYITSSFGFQGATVHAAEGILGAAITQPQLAAHIKSSDILLPDECVIGLHTGTNSPVLNTNPNLNIQFKENRGMIFRHDSADEKLIISGGDQHARIGIGDNVDYDEIDAQLHVFGDLKVTGTGSFGKVHTRIVSSSIMFSSGSNIFGDATTDTHTFNGNITGSNHISVSGDITTKDIYVENVYRFIGDTVRMAEDTVGDNLSITGGGLKIAGDMTASGNISSSGTIIGDVGVIGTDTPATNMELTVKGDISGSGNVYAKTFRSEHLFSFLGTAVDGEEYYFSIGGNPLNDVISSANTTPSQALTHTAMCNLSIKRLKIQFSLPVASISTFKIYCRRWDGNSGFDADGNWETIGTVWTVKSAAINDNERFYHAPSDWNINAGEIWGLQWEANGSTPSVFFNGGIVIEENWNTLISS
tara:strand:- start:408 stop:2351 length:1944 start_codon:yes stop_codon:yes gene_type:complete